MIANHDKSLVFQDLPIGDKLALKGQLFELGKRLHEMENKRDKHEEEEKIAHNSKLNAHSSNHHIYSDKRKAEIIRKQKMQILQLHLEREEKSKLTFAPSTNSNRNRKSVDESQQPVYERLLEYGKSIKQKQHQKLIDEQNKSKISHHPSRFRKFEKESSTCSDEDPDSIDVSVDQFLYIDARNREERIRQREKDYLDDILSGVNLKKINSTSEILLKRKAERSIRNIFEWLQDMRRQLKTEEVTVSICQETIQFVADQILNLDEFSHYFKHRHLVVKTLWSLLGNQDGQVTFANFYQLLIRQAKEGESRWSSIALNEEFLSDASNILYIFYIGCMILIKSHHPKSLHSDNDKFIPKINETSKKLAGQKVLREKDILINLLPKSSEVTYTDLMYAQSFFSQQKLQVAKKKADDSVLEDCTFKPNIYTSKKFDLSSRQSVMSSLNSKKHCNNLTVKDPDTSTRQINEMNQSTGKTNLSAKQHRDAVGNIIVKPFYFATEARASRPKAEKMSFVIDVNLGSTQVGNLKIAAGEDVNLCVNQFCKANNLDDVAAEVLVSIVKKHLVEQKVSLVGVNK